MNSCKEEKHEWIVGINFWATNRYGACTWCVTFCSTQYWCLNLIVCIVLHEIQYIYLSSMKLKNVKFLLLQLKDPHLSMLKAAGFDYLVIILSRATLCFQMEVKQWFLKKFMIFPHYMWTGNLIQRLNNIKHV